jgi:putative phage-type endonuclease
MGSLKNMLIDTTFDRVHSHYKYLASSPKIFEEKITKRLTELIGSIPPSYVKNRMVHRLEQQRILKTIQENPKNYVQQRSTEWFKLREDLISASDLYCAVGSLDKSTRGDNKQLYKKKCGYETQDFVNSPAVLHGVKFEKVACDIYATMTKTTVFDFGLIQHPTYSFIGASPDGITEDGVMLEIKSPYSRIIHRGTGVPPEYYLQIQGQLEVCDLDECDYFECSFKLYPNVGGFDQDVDDSNMYTRDLMEKGILITFYDNQVQKTDYLYSDIYISDKEKKEWLDTTLNTLRKDLTKTITSVEYWRKDYQNTIRVYRNKKEFQEIILPRVQEVWDNILRYRNNKSAYMDEVVKTRRSYTSANSTQDESPNRRGSSTQKYGSGFMDPDVEEDNKCCPTKDQQLAMKMRLLEAVRSEQSI